MKNALIAVVILIVLLGSTIFFVSQSSPEGAPVGTLPSVALQDDGGSTVTIQEYQDDEHILVINSWASWCPFCVNELPDLVALQEEFPDTVRVIAVNRKESLNAGNSYLEGLGIQKDIVFLYDLNDSWYRTLGGFTMPETIFVNRRGEIIVHKRGFMALPEMREHVETTFNNN